MLSPSADTEMPMDFSSEYDTSDKSSMDDSDEACSIPGSFSPDNNQDGTGGDQRYEEILDEWFPNYCYLLTNLWHNKQSSENTHRSQKCCFLLKCTFFPLFLQPNPNPDLVSSFLHTQQ